MRPVLVSGLTAVLVTGLTSFLLHQWLSPWTWKTLIINVAIILAANIIPILFIVEKKDWDKIRKVLKIK
jgi:hypothetical protein